MQEAGYLIPFVDCSIASQISIVRRDPFCRKSSGRYRKISRPVPLSFRYSLALSKRLAIDPEQLDGYKVGRRGGQVKGELTDKLT